MSRKKGPLLIPFGRTSGEMFSWTGNKDEVGVDTEHVVWRENFEFDDCLEYQSYAGGRSAMSMNLRSRSTGLEYSLFWSTFHALLCGYATCIVDGLGTPLAWQGRWTFAKRGQNYGLILAGEDK